MSKIPVVIRFASKLVVAMALLWPQATPAVQAVGPGTRYALHRNAYFEAIRLGPPNVSQCEQRPAPGTRRSRLIDLLVFGDHSAPVADDYPPDVAAEIRKVMQRSESYRSTRPKASGSALDEIVHGELVRYERRLFVMTDAPDAARLSVAYVDALRPCYEWEGYSDCPRREAEFAGQYRRSNPSSPFRDYLPLLEAHRWLCAAAGFDYEKDATGAAASRRSSAEALSVARASDNLLVRTAARELAARPRCYSE